MRKEVWKKYSTDYLDGIYKSSLLIINRGIQIFWICDWFGPSEMFWFHLCKDVSIQIVIACILLNCLHQQIAKYKSKTWLVTRKNLWNYLSQREIGSSLWLVFSSYSHKWQHNAFCFESQVNVCGVVPLSTNCRIL